MNLKRSFTILSEKSCHVITRSEDFSKIQRFSSVLIWVPENVFPSLLTWNIFFTILFVMRGLECCALALFFTCFLGSRKVVESALWRLWDICSFRGKINEFFEGLPIGFCTSTVANTPDKAMIHGRNLDFDFPRAVDELIVNLNFTKNGTTLYQGEIFYYLNFLLLHLAHSLKIFLNKKNILFRKKILG